MAPSALLQQVVGRTPFCADRSERRAVSTVRTRTVVRCRSASQTESTEIPRRKALQAAAAAVLAATLSGSTPAVQAADLGAATPDDGNKLLCDASCTADIDKKERTKTASGLEYVDIAPGKGPSPTVGIQVVAHYVAKTPEGRIFANSLMRKEGPYYIRVGSGQVIPGLDEGLLGMQTGGIRRFYIPGDLSFPKGLASAPGRPKVPPNSPVIFDVQLTYIPGVSDDLEFDE